MHELQNSMRQYWDNRPYSMRSRVGINLLAGSTFARAVINKQIISGSDDHVKAVDMFFQQKHAYNCKDN